MNRRVAFWVGLAWVASCTPNAPHAPQAALTPSGSLLQPVATAAATPAATTAPSATPLPSAPPPQAVNLQPAGPVSVEAELLPASEAALLGYDLLQQPLPVTCSEPYVAAATAPEFAAKRDGWFWPWVVQALVAHSHLFFISDNAELAPSEIRLEQRSGKAGTLALSVHCGSAQTCNNVARVLRAVIPHNQARTGCGTPPGEAPVVYPIPGALALIPSVLAGKVLDAASACARLAACSRQQGTPTDAARFLACQARPASFPLTCAAQSICHAVASCAGYAKGSVQFAYGVSLSEQVELHAERTSQLGFVPDVGDGGLDAGGVNILYDGPSSADPQRLGDWATLSLSVSLSSKSAEGHYEEGSVSWAPAFILRRGAHALLGPEQSTHADPFTTTNMPSMGSAFGHSQLFDYDGDGIVELLLHAIDTHHTSSPKRRLSVWKYTEAGVIPYPGLDGLALIFAQDVDRDGRPDLVLDAGVALPDSDQHSSLASDEWLLLHSLPGGAFSRPEAVARAFDSGQR
jgi:hypothetical protein